MKIYTKTGDKGDTRLFDGTPVRKNDARVDTYGEVDELNAAVGAAGAFLEDRELKSILTEIQRDLFCVGAELARMELRTAFPAIARRFPDLTLATDRVDYRRLSIVYGVDSLPVRLQPEPVPAAGTA